MGYRIKQIILFQGIMSARSFRHALSSDDKEYLRTEITKGTATCLSLTREDDPHFSSLSDIIVQKGVLVLRHFQTEMAGFIPGCFPPGGFFPGFRDSDLMPLKKNLLSCDRQANLPSK